MGKLVDADKVINDYAHYGIPHSYDVYDLEDILNECSTVEAIPKAEYENRLKADMIAMLAEIQLEIEELCTPPAYQEEDYFLSGTNRCSELIQTKINSLKKESENKE